jgi:hypothetical protein
MEKKQNFFLLIIFLIITIITSPQIELPLKLINISYSKYSKPKKIFINKNSLYNIKSFHHLKKSFITDSQTTLSCNIELLNSFLFAAEIEIGSNNQKFDVVLDTGSEILWVPEINSINSNNQIEHFYNPKNSKTSKNTAKSFEVRYGTGYCKGYYYQDQIKFLSNEKYDIIFGSANNSIFEVDGTEGIMGLAKYYPNYQLSPLLTLQKKGVLKYTSFSFKYDNKKGNLIFYAGKPHSDFNTKNVAFCNLLNNNRYEKMLWACKLSYFGLIKNTSDIYHNDNINSKADISIILDTGTNSIILPYSIINYIENKLRKYNCVVGSSEDEYDISYYIVCFDIYNIPDVSLQFGDYVLILNKYKMFFIVDLGLGITGYLLNVQFQKDLDVAIIGQNFFTEFHTLFDAENNVLKFYSEYKGKIINLNNYLEDEGNSFSAGTTLLLIIVIFLIIIYFCHRSYQKNHMEENNYDWMGKNNGNDSKFNNINNTNDYKAII